MDDKTLEADERKPFSAFLPFPLSWAALDLFCPGITALRGWQSFRQTGQGGTMEVLIERQRGEQNGHWTRVLARANEDFGWGRRHRPTQGVLVNPIP